MSLGDLLFFGMRLRLRFRSRPRNSMTPAELAHWLGITTKAQSEATAAVLFVQVSAPTCSLMQRIQDRFVVSVWPLASLERERSPLFLLLD